MAKVMELFKAQFEANMASFNEREKRFSNPRVFAGVTKFDDVKKASKLFFGGIWVIWRENVKTDFDKNIANYIDLYDDIKELKKNNLVTIYEDSSWIARQTGKTTKLCLTVKGLRAFYNLYFKKAKATKKTFKTEMTEERARELGYGSLKGRQEYINECVEKLMEALNG